MKRLATALACTSLLATLAACGTPDGGYYDRNGNWIATSRPHEITDRKHAPLPGGTKPYYSRAGYYDANGYYLARDAFYVEPAMYPPRGMCRVWFADRPVHAQPPIESCEDIQYRVPAGAYVVYGG